MKSIIAWRLFWITKSFNKDKNEGCETILSPQEWQILYKRFHQGEAPVTPPLKIEDIYYWIARLGGISTETLMVRQGSYVCGKVGRALII